MDRQVRAGAHFCATTRRHIAAMDLFVVPTIGFKLLYAFVVVRLNRRELVWINVTQNPTAEWIARQITEAFPWNELPRYLIRDQDRIYGEVALRRIRAMGIRDKPIAPASPWQNGFTERLIGSIRLNASIISSSWVRLIYVEFCEITRAITTKSEHTDHWTRMLRPFALFSGLVPSRHIRSSAGFTITTCVFEFSVHTPISCCVFSVRLG